MAMEAMHRRSAGYWWRFGDLSTLFGSNGGDSHIPTCLERINVGCRRVNRSAKGLDNLNK